MSTHILQTKDFVYDITCIQNELKNANFPYVYFNWNSDVNLEQYYVGLDFDERLDLNDFLDIDLKQDYSLQKNFKKLIQGFNLKHEQKNNLLSLIDSKTYFEENFDNYTHDLIDEDLTILVAQHYFIVKTQNFVKKIQT